MIRQPEREQLNRLNVKTLDQVRDATRLRHYSIRTENAYVGWIKRYILFHDKRHPSHQGIRPGRLLPSLREPLTGYSVPCVHFP